MKLIPNWQEKNLVCDNCGTTKSVKYSDREQILCNKCVLIKQEEFMKLQSELIKSV